MRTSLNRLGKLLGGALFEVPGWPDAPKSVRFRRALPILLPAALVLVLGAGSVLVHKPHMNSVRRSHADLLQMESQLEGLRMVWSDQYAEELEAEARAISNHLLPTVRAAENFLAGVGAQSDQLGWEFRFQVYETPTAPTDGSSSIAFAPALVRLKAREDNQTPLSTFLRVVELLEGSNSHVDLTRLAVTVGDLDQPTVEMNLRMACAVKDEKSPE